MTPLVSIPWLLEKLQREQYELTDPRHTVTDLARRQGWNSRATALIAELRIEMGLQELRDIEAIEPMDLQLKRAMAGG
jgi:hypothetical protein